MGFDERDKRIADTLLREKVRPWEKKFNHGGMEADYSQSDRWSVKQDLTDYIEAAKADKKEFEENRVKGKPGRMRKFASIPHIVAMDIKEKHGIDLFDPATMQDKDKMNKFKRLIASEYSVFMTSTT